MLNKDMKEIFETISKKFDKICALRDKALVEHRELIKMSSLVIRAVHRGEYKEAEELLTKAKEKARKLTESLKDCPEVYFGGFVHDSMKELAEACITLSLIRDGVLPKPEEIEVGYPAYLNGLGEAIGELRRHIIDKIRKNQHEDSEELLAWMDESYYLLMSMDYPDAITMSLRRTSDIARSLIEKTRGDLTMHIRQSSFENKIHELEKKLK